MKKATIQLKATIVTSMIALRPFVWKFTKPLMLSAAFQRPRSDDGTKSMRIERSMG